ncbi:CWC16 protein [Ampelomyces quisqualis]|uniref:CWC16 protein n=1 Tax=Ampelomyces quisqualis TaxID=50730 RepID=A0A6A5QCL0_AMPQU|nr:CWC16 protein [Ampelomyces quisqualis]
MQGFNMGRYYPPDASNPPTFNASHPLGKRANKISQGILTVRFELPFAVWCDNCTPPAIVGQGVRFNAAKKKVGNYHSTPIWSFRMKHSACGGWWEIRTDPKKAEYIVVEGARRRDYGPGDQDATAEGDLKALTEEERERRRNDAFASLEGKIEEKGTENKNKERIEYLYDKSEVWRDPYDVNARLRKSFRDKRKVLERDEQQKEAIREKFGLGFDIVDETEADRRRAGMTDFGAVVQTDRLLDSTSWKPIFQDASFGECVETRQGPKKLKAEVKAERSRQMLQQALVDNTKATVDPFLKSEGRPTPKPTFGLLKRKRPYISNDAEDIATTTGSITGSNDHTTGHATKKPVVPSALVEYDSD